MSTKPTLRPFQRLGAQWLSQRTRALLADTMGLGKTPQAIAACDMTGMQRIIVIAPLATALGWQREAQAWGSGQISSLRTLRRRDPIPTTGPCSILIPWTDLAARIDEITAAQRYDLCILDEAHRAKSGSKAAMALAAIGGRRRVGGQWVSVPCVAGHAYRTWALTGTPMPNGRPIELLPLLDRLGAIGPGQPWRNRTEYTDEHCKQMNRFARSGYDMDGAKRLDQLNAGLARSGLVLRREPADVAGELPDLQRSIIPLAVKDALPPEDRARVIERSRDSRSGLPAFEDMSEYRAQMGARKSKPSAAWTLDHLADAGPASALVVFVWHKSVGQAIAATLAAALKQQVEFASGDDDTNSRQAKVDRFAATTGPQVLVASLAACGTGMPGMQKRTRECVFVETPWSPEHADQGEGRIRRMGGLAAGDGMSMAYYLVADESLDAHVARVVNDKRNRIQDGLGAGTYERSATADAAALPMPPPPPPPPQAEESEEDPASVGWGWLKDDATGEWRVACWSSAGSKSAWVGAVVPVTTKSTGIVRQLRLTECVRSGISGKTGKPYCIWRFDPTKSAEDAHRRQVGYLGKRATGRRLDHDNAPLATDQERDAAQAAHEASQQLTGLDADRASVRNDMGWSQADGTIGRILAETPPEYWVRGTLTLARAILSTYRRTQVSAHLGARIWEAQS
jgi:hypothetical protein